MEKDFGGRISQFLASTIYWHAVSFKRYRGSFPRSQFLGIFPPPRVNARNKLGEVKERRWGPHIAEHPVRWSDVPTLCIPRTNEIAVFDVAYVARLGGGALRSAALSKSPSEYQARRVNLA